MDFSILLIFSMNQIINIFSLWDMFSISLIYIVYPLLICFFGHVVWLVYLTFSTRDWTRDPSSGNMGFNHWATREFHMLFPCLFAVPFQASWDGSLHFWFQSFLKVRLHLYLEYRQYIPALICNLSASLNDVLAIVKGRL